jgi:hypothetical protein
MESSLKTAKSLDERILSSKPQIVIASTYKIYNKVKSIIPQSSGVVVNPPRFRMRNVEKYQHVVLLPNSLNLTEGEMNSVKQWRKKQNVIFIETSTNSDDLRALFRLEVVMTKDINPSKDALEVIRGGCRKVVTSRFFDQGTQYYNLELVMPDKADSNCVKRVIPYKAILRKAKKDKELRSKYPEILEEMKLMNSLELPLIYLPNKELEKISMVYDQGISAVLSSKTRTMNIATPVVIIVGLAMSGKTTLARRIGTEVIEFDSFNAEGRIEALRKSHRLKSDIPKGDEEFEKFRTETRVLPYRQWFISAGRELKDYISDNVDLLSTPKIIGVCNTIAEANNFNVLSKTIIVLQPDWDTISLNYERSQDENKSARVTLNDVWLDDLATNDGYPTLTYDQLEAALMLWSRGDTADE